MISPTRRENSPQNEVKPKLLNGRLNSYLIDITLLFRSLGCLIYKREYTGGEAINVHIN